MRTAWKVYRKCLITGYVDNVENGEENSPFSVIINRICGEMSKNAAFYRIFEKGEI